MDIGSVTGIASLATTMSAERLSAAVGTAVLKKALDLQAQGALALLAALPSPAAGNLPPHLGQNVNVAA